MELVSKKLGEMDRLMTTSELGTLMGVKTATVLWWWKRGIIPASCGRRIGTEIRFDPLSIRTWLLEGELPNGFERHPAWPDDIYVSGARED